MDRVAYGRAGMYSIMSLLIARASGNWESRGSLLTMLLLHFSCATTHQSGRHITPVFGPPGAAPYCARNMFPRIKMKRESTK